MGNPQNTGARRIVNAASFSMAGLRAAWVNEAAFRQECILTLVMTPFGFWLGQNALERVALIGSCLLVIVVELLNSGIEAAVVERRYARFPARPRQRFVDRDSRQPACEAAGALELAQLEVCAYITFLDGIFRILIVRNDAARQAK